LGFFVIPQNRKSIKGTNISIFAEKTLESSENIYRTKKRRAGTQKDTRKKFVIGRMKSKRLLNELIKTCPIMGLSYWQALFGFREVEAFH